MKTTKLAIVGLGNVGPSPPPLPSPPLVLAGLDDLHVKDVLKSSIFYLVGKNSPKDVDMKV